MKASDTIASKVTRRFFLILCIAQVILFAASYLFVEKNTESDARERNEEMATIYRDLILAKLSSENVPADEEFTKEALSIGDYVCGFQYIDFAYMFVPDPETGTIRYLCVSQKEAFNEQNPYDRFIGKIAEYRLTEDETAVWNGEKEMSHSITRSQAGHEISTMMRITDPFGNPVMVGVDQSYESVRHEVNRTFSLIALVTFLINCFIYALVYFVIKRRISEPVQKVTKAMSEFIAEGDCSAAKLEVSGNDEFALISSAFNSMTDDISGYLSNIKKLSHEQEQQNAQLEISSRIQRGFLQDTYYEAGNCVIYADMIPAKYVAGDLYDYMQIGDGKVLTVIADVSGKGAAASIFMAVTLVLIRVFAKLGMTPSEILRKVNETVSENNPSMLFLTAIVGIYDCNDQTYTYVNAGHNLPYIINDKVTALSGPQNTILGIFPGEEFTESTVRLETGDTLFLYTDGVNEALDEKGEFFGMERLEASLEEFILAKKENPIDFVNGKVSEFVGAAERHDDITMLCFSPAETKTLTLKPEEKEFEKVKNAILSLPIPRADQLSLCLSAEEIFINTCSYAYGRGNEKDRIRVSVNLSNRVTLKFIDMGTPFDPTKDVQEADDYDMETQIGGLGRLIAFGSVDDAKYEYKNGRNILTLTKYLV